MNQIVIYSTTQTLRPLILMERQLCFTQKLQVIKKSKNCLYRTDVQKWMESILITVYYLNEEAVWLLWPLNRLMCSTNFPQALYEHSFQLNNNNLIFDLIESILIITMLYKLIAFRCISWEKALCTRFSGSRLESILCIISYFSHIN